MRFKDYSVGFFDGVGVVLGLAICDASSLYPDMVDIAVPIWVVSIAIGFSATVGAIFLLIPTFEAAIIHSIRALRHE